MRLRKEKEVAIIRVGDDLVDEETGEYAGPADGYLPDVLDSHDDLVAYMHRLSDLETALHAARLQLESVIENCRKMVKRHEDRIAWLDRKYGVDAKAIAFSSLPRKKDGSFASKTFTCPWGTVSFREVKPTIEILDEEKALDWARSNMPSAVKVKESLLITPLKEAFIGKDANDTVDLPDGFGIVEGRQIATINTLPS